MTESKSAVQEGIEQLRSIVLQDKQNFEDLSVRLEPLLALQSASQKLHRAFFQQFGKIHSELTEDQLDASIDGLQSMYYELLMTTSVLLRLRASDAMNHQRRLIEVAAFVHEHLSDPESAKRWREASHSSAATTVRGQLDTNKRKKYKSRYQAHHLVEKYFKRTSEEEGIGLNYDAACLFVHPSVISSRERIKKSETKYSLLSHDKNSAENVSTVVRLVVGVHVLFLLLLHSIAESLSKFEAFDQKAWEEAMDEWSEVWNPFNENDQLAYRPNASS